MRGITLRSAKNYIINNLEEQKRCLKENDHCSIVLLSGAPGSGKSDLMEQIAIELGMGLNPQYLATMMIEQFGMPLPTMEQNAKFQRWSNPEFYSVYNLRVSPKKQSDGFIILFMDDIHLATKTIQQYFFQLLTYRSIHSKKMPDNFLMVAAGNRSIDKAGAQPIMAPIINRFYTIDVVATADNWIEDFAIPNQVRSDIISFIELYPDLLQSEPLESRAWASPRSWTYFSQELDMMEKNHPLEFNDILTIGSGHIGLEYTTKYAEYVELFLKWNANQYLNGVPMLDLKDMPRLHKYTFMAAITSELLKDLRHNNWKMNDENIIKKINIVKSLFTTMMDICPEIVPLGLRNLLLSEKITNNEATLYYKLTIDNPKLLDGVKQIITKS